MRQLNILLHQPEFNALTNHAKQTASAQALWLSIAPKILSQFSHANSIKNHELLLYADNSAVAAKIKLMLPSLLIQLEKQGCEVTAIRVKVQVKSKSAPRQKGIKKLSSKAADSLQHLAKKLDGSPLAEVLNRLANKAD